METSKFKDSYGNDFTDFDAWPSGKPMDSQVAAEYFLLMCFVDSVVRIKNNGVLTEEEADIAIDRARHGLLVAAAGTVNYALNHQKKGETANGAWST